MSLQITLIQGGGAGFDQALAVQRILKVAGADIVWQEHLAGFAAIEQGQPALSEVMIRSVRDNGVALKTKLLAPPGTQRVNYNVEFRRALGLFAAVRPIKNLRGLPARFQDVDILVIRELTEDLYAAIEHEIIPGIVQSIKVVTESACRRFLGFAFAWARDNGRKLIHCVHKANILKLADGLFLEVFRAIAKDFPRLQTKEIIVDNCCMQMVSNPRQFDVMVMGNHYGDIVSDLGAGIVGGISATAGINIGEKVRVYEAFHGGGRGQIGANQANPLPLLLPAVDLLESIGHKQLAERILTAAQNVLSAGLARTPDLGGTATTTAVADAIIAELSR